jgi:hypothetical protein
MGTGTIIELRCAKRQNLTLQMVVVNQLTVLQYWSRRWPKNIANILTRHRIDLAVTFLEEARIMK